MKINTTSKNSKISSAVFAAAVFLLFLVTLIFATSAGQSALGGNAVVEDGSAENPYLIGTAAELDAVREHLRDRSVHFKVVADISLAAYLAEGGEGYAKWGDAGWMPIGDTDNDFWGSFDGNGFSIEGIWINRVETDDVGLFSILDRGATVKNLGLSTDDSMGGIKGQDYIGGIAGRNFSTAVISNCRVKSRVEGDYAIGGITGRNNGTIEDCLINGFINANNCAGGVAGENFGTIIRCRASGEISVTNSYAGGIASTNNLKGNITECAAVCAVSGSNVVGGITGRNYAIIKNCYSQGNITSNRYAGGIVGFNEKPIIDGYSCSISDCYSAGGITADSNGGVAGKNEEGASIENCYFDNQTAGVTNGIFWNDATSFMGMTTTQMKAKATYSGWDFSRIWAIDEGNDYPAFISEYFDGDGSAENPLLIYDAAQLDSLRLFLGDGYQGLNFKIAGDIDLSAYLAEGGEGYAKWGNEGWMPIGTNENSFYGNLDGGGYQINGLWINRPDMDNVGLFGCISESGKIEKVGVNLDDLAGGIRGKNYVGGIAGSSYGHVEYCHANVNIIAAANSAGGLIGKLDGGDVKSSFAYGSVKGEGSVGGLIGSVSGDNNIQNSYANVAVEATNDLAGGFIGSMTGGSEESPTQLTRCYSVGKVTCAGENAGAFIGQSFEVLQVTECYYDSTVNAGGDSYGALPLTTDGFIVKDLNTVGETPIFALRAASDNYCYYPELLCFKDSEKMNDIAASEASARIERIVVDISAIEGNISYGETLADAVFGGSVTATDFGDVAGTFKWDDQSIMPDYFDGIGRNDTLYDICFVSDNNLFAVADFRLALTIAKRKVTVINIVGSRVYDGTTDSIQLQGEAVGFIEGDQVGISSASGIPSFADAGEDVPLSGVTFYLENSDSEKYEIIQPTGVTGTIAPAELTISGVSAIDRIYDKTNIVMTEGGVLDGVFGADGDEISIVHGSATIGSVSAGSNKSVATNISLDGAKAANYTLKQPDYVTVDITPRAITVSGLSVQNKIYNGNDHATIQSSNMVISGLIEGDVVDFICQGGAFADINVSDNSILVHILAPELEGEDADNYFIDRIETVLGAILPAPLYVTANDASKTYDGQPYGGFTAQFSGFVADEDEGVLGGALSFGGSAVGASNASVVPYSIIPSGLTAANYNIIYQSGTLTIGKAEGAGNMVAVGWKSGEESSLPFFTALTADYGNAVFMYKLKSAPEDGAYSQIMPTAEGEYTVRAIFAATENYEALMLSADFTIAAADVVVPQPLPEAELSAGAGAGIAIGVMLFVIIGGFAIIWFVVKKKTFKDIKGIFKK